MNNTIRFLVEHSTEDGGWDTIMRSNCEDRAREALRMEKVMAHLHPAGTKFRLVKETTTHEVIG